MRVGIVVVVFVFVDAAAMGESIFVDVVVGCWSVLKGGCASFAFALVKIEISHVYDKSKINHHLVVSSGV